MERVRKFLGRDEEKEDEKAAVEEEPSTEAPPAAVPAKPEVKAPEPEPEPEQEPEVEEAVPEAEAEPTPARPGDTIPNHSDFTERLKYLFANPTAAAGMEGPDEFALEFMAMGERFNIKKQAHGEVSFGTGSVPEEDVFVRISNSTVAELLSAPTFVDFSKIYIRHYRKPDAGKFVKIELRKDISSMNRRGYARVPILKLLVGQMR
ncbi:MAG: hypothetical protein ACFFD9_02330 [Candidatus Thorarchaeota archaeon]